MLTELFILLAVVGFFVYKRVKKTYSYFKENNIPDEEFSAIFVAMKDNIWNKKSLFEQIVNQYNKFDSKICGVYQMGKPVFILRDPELIRQVTVKHFDHFVNHPSFLDEETSGLFGRSLFVMKDQKWKDMRATLSPAFTGSKMRLMFELITDVVQQAIDHLKKDPKMTASGLDLDMKDFFTRITNDMIATSAFGIKVNSLADPKNEFYTIGKSVGTFGTLQNAKLFLFMFAPWLAKALKLQLFSPKVSDYFMSLVLDAMKYRAEHNIFRPDMINMLMEAQGTFVGRKDEKQEKPAETRKWSDEDIVAQCFLFFFAGFETSAVLMCLASHEIMENPDVQRRLQDEIKEVKESLNGKPLSYETLQSMKYMDAVISETLRKWPPSPATDRMCTKNFRLKCDDVDVEIKTGQGVMIPTAGIHRDPAFFPDPLKFDPERFSEENKANIQQSGTYMPFGIGPRSCIASRFALMEVKAMLFHLLNEFNFEAAEKSTIPLKLIGQGFQMLPKKGFWIKFVPRAN